MPRVPASRSVRVDSELWRQALAAFPSRSGVATSSQVIAAALAAKAVTDQQRRDRLDAVLLDSTIEQLAGLAIPELSPFAPRSAPPLSADEIRTRIGAMLATIHAFRQAGVRIQPDGADDAPVG